MCAPKGFKAWYPLNVVTGGSTANTLVQGLETTCPRTSSWCTSLTNNIGQAIYKDIEQLEQMCRRMPMLKAAKELEYGFMVLDKSDPTSMMKPPGDKVYVIPRGGNQDARAEGRRGVPGGGGQGEEDARRS